MNPQVRTGPARLNSYHGPKRQLLGPHAGQAAPAWRASNIPTGPALANGAASSSKKSITQGSKILLSNLPMDVGESEVEELFKRTVGPMKDLFVIYNSQGKSKGMAIVTFHRPGDAAIARSKYNHKIVDGRHKLKIEVVTDSDGVVSPAAPAKQANPPSLLARIGKPVDVTPKQPKLPHIAAAPIAAAPAPAKPRPQLSNKTNDPQITVGPNRRRQKKGAKRVKKSVAQLDKDMDDYRAGVPAPDAMVV